MGDVLGMGASALVRYYLSYFFNDIYVFESETHLPRGWHPHLRMELCEYGRLPHEN
jgi:hypothetical protein